MQIHDYDDNNVFAKILRGEIPCEKVYENEHALAFKDINAQAPVHVLVIPKGRYRMWDDFTANASDAEQAAFNRAISEVAEQTGLLASGFRLLCNNGPDSHQEVPHLHMHVVGGRPLGRLLDKVATG